MSDSPSALPIRPPLRNQKENLAATMVMIVVKHEDKYVYVPAAGEFFYMFLLKFLSFFKIVKIFTPLHDLKS